MLKSTIGNELGRFKEDHQTRMSWRLLVQDVHVLAHGYLGNKTVTNTMRDVCTIVKSHEIF